jgi:hypothetical protein
MWRIVHPNERKAAMSKSDKSVRIRELNDALRRTFTGGKVVMTDGVTALSEGNLAQLLEKVRSFDKGPVAGLVGIEGGIVSGVINLESPA